MSTSPKYKNLISALYLVIFDKLNLKMEEVPFRNVISDLHIGDNGKGPCECR